MAQWRRFAFFDKEVLKDANGPWMKGVDITSMSANRGLICVGDADGFVHLSNRSLEARKFQAHELFVSHVVMMQRSNVLVTIGDGIDPRSEELRAQSKAIAEAGRAPNAEDMYTSKPSGKSTAVVRFWRTDQQDREGKPKLLQQIPIFAKKYPEEAVTAFAVNDDLSQFAVGLKNGAVILFRSDLKRRTDRPPHLLQPAGQYPVTGLSFTSKPVTASVSHVFLYASTRRGLTCYHCSHDDPALVKSAGGAAALPPRTTVLDERGVDMNCSCVNEEGEIAVGQTDAVYFYTTEDRSVCFGFEGEKKYLCFFKHYLLVAHVDPRGRHQVNVYDLQNKFIAFNWTLTNTSSKAGMRKPPLAANARAPGARFGLDEMEEVRHVVCEFGAIFVVSSMGHVYRLSEKDTTSKLEILFRKNLYSIAISLAFSSNYDVNSIIDIFRMYGDHLYQKGDYDGSLRQYVRTIGHVEPSYVIRRFLDAQRIHNLTAYLEALHEKAFANAEHTTLLLNCYTKLKDVKKLDKFIQLDEVIDAKKTNGTKSGSDSGMTTPRGAGASNLNFDVETAISVLWENYPQHALTLAKKHEEHSWYLKIQLDHISYVDSEDSVALSENEKERVADALEYIEHLSFSEADSNLRKYGRTLVTHLPGPTTELLKRLCTGKFVPGSPSLKSDPGDFLHLFVSHRAQLKEFLQYIVEVETVSNTSIGNTLLEMVLSDDDEDGENGKRSIEEKEEAVLRILDNPRVKYDEDHALIHLQMHGMKKGKRYLYNKLHMYHMLVQFHIEENDDQSILEEVRKHGDKDPNLWSLALKYFAERGPLPKGATSGEEWKELKQLLALIDTNPAIPPLQVVQVLSQSRELPVSVIKQYVVNQLASDEKKIEEDEEKIKAFKGDTKQMKEEIAQLSSRAVVFQATKCDLCNHDLDLPAVHFMCQHSFHLNCISETDRECITCSMDHRHILGLKTQLEQKAGNHEQFYNQLETAADGFHTIAEYFGKGIFKSNEVLLDEGSFEARFSAEF
ncbi:hypothetical protein BBO99_00007163 [Phytophthora kernoviae]|uniref:Vacuolar protein sorting-associated protein 11 homolog n=2 Tax=Phytophthora kernoviae TaxID=325452 RepID=A0A3R7GTL0_9STRA|nr:hypothetical protein G195_008168 [Phytophthora kernoviae 00238/432]KAG2520334.1 hypothetical protein JM16_006751 [Phytophthora kernoviae]KAG2521433.1 hypothetical protein JM18_006614 [Phytophthora kernoviae]RLN25776.1 hypothetical protein BBI17_007121 [Phytophthora kernoviae]RLN76919.1 hypothetical protein BBO99_00007163 [Phytophthora kernoviae]